MPANAISEIGIVLYRGAQTAAVHGLTDLCVRDSFLALRNGSHSPLRWDVPNQSHHPIHSS
jgi:hypothetical protein